MSHSDLYKEYELNREFKAGMVGTKLVDSDEIPLGEKISRLEYNLIVAVNDPISNYTHGDPNYEVGQILNKLIQYRIIKLKRDHCECKG